MALDAQGVARPRCVGVIETCEESGSYDLPAYLDTLAPRMGNVQLVIALDSGCGNYDQLWATTSLRGLVNGTLTVKVLNEGVHSGDAGGIVPSSFRVARALLDRVDDARTGTVGAPAFQCEIPPARTIQARQAAEILGDALWQRFPWASCASGQGELVQPPTRDKVELILNRTWRASLSVIGADGLPPTASAGNVLRPETVLKLSLRIPPAVDGATATRALKQILESDPPHNADVRFDADTGATGWNAPEFAPWLAESLNEASLACYGKPTAYMGEGGTIPFMGMLGAKFPAAQILVTGVLGPKSNAHGPNEFLHVPYAKRLCAVIALTMAACARQG
jgi:acetylornithine deacetylase/succinyl-diaminopimelate desuccinylase-like protein